MFRFLAQATLAIHITLILFLAAGFLAAVTGYLVQHRIWSRIYWPVFVITAIAELLPSCPLDVLEAWFRHHYDIAWSRTADLEDYLQHGATGAWFPELHAIGLLILVTGSFYAWFRYHGGRQWLNHLRLVLTKSKGQGFK